MSRIPFSLMLAAILTSLVAGCGPSRPKQITFAEAGEGPLDFDRIEADHPLTAAARAELTPANLTTLNQVELDQLYGRLTAGPIPDGPYRGTIVFAEGGGPKRLSARLARIPGLALDIKIEQLDHLGEALWKGKVFYRDQGLLRNMIDHEGVVRRIFGADPAALRRETILGREVGLLFPARLYCGESLLDGRRESVIIDYAETDRLDGYIPEIDYLAGRDALRVRDEIRMIRPGFYLGRAYLRETFVLTFTLYNESVARAAIEEPEDCWDGRGPRPDAVAHGDSVSSAAPVQQ